MPPRRIGARLCLVFASMSADGGSVCVEVSDNGCGLPLNPRRGVGLASIRERVSELGGTVTIAPGEKAGTCVCATVPLPVAEP